jgi:hypothetical protein
VLLTVEDTGNHTTMGSLVVRERLEHIDTWDLTFRLTVTDDYKLLHADTSAPTATATVTETIVGQKALESVRKEKRIKYKLNERVYVRVNVTLRRSSI